MKSQNFMRESVWATEGASYNKMAEFGNETGRYPGYPRILDILYQLGMSCCRYVDKKIREKINWIIVVVTSSCFMQGVVIGDVPQGSVLKYAV